MSKKENGDLGKKLKILEKDKEILKLDPSVCDIAHDMSDQCPLNTNNIVKDYLDKELKDEGKKTFADMDGNCTVDNKSYFKNDIALKIMQKWYLMEED